MKKEYLKPLTTILLLFYIVFVLLGTGSAFFHYALPHFTTVLTTSLGFAFVFFHGARQMGWKKLILLVVMTFVVSLAFESVGVKTGLVYGPYHYSSKLGLKFLGLVPYIIPIAWFLMMYPAYVIANSIIPAQWSTWLWRLGIATVGGIIMTAWDVAMDPFMSGAKNWIWEVDGAFYGVPIQNFWGWWLTVFTTFLIFMIIAKIDSKSIIFRGQKYNQYVVLSYAVTGLSSVLIDFQVGLGGAGLAGIMAMMPWVITGHLGLLEDA